jgi:hypothetical protein
MWPAIYFSGVNNYLKVNHPELKLKLAYVLKNSCGRARSRLQLVSMDGTEMYQFLNILCEQPLFRFV